MNRPTSILLLAGLGLAALTLWLRWPGLGFNVWSLDEAIHAAAARVLLEGGVLYRDVIDQRTPLSYYAFAGIFAVAGENNLWAVRFCLALMIAATAFMLGVLAARWRGPAAGAGTALIYVALASAWLFPGDANAAHTEWFLAFFTSAAALTLLGSGRPPDLLRCCTGGLLLGLAFLSKQPALLDLMAPAAALLWMTYQRDLNRHETGLRLVGLLAGWLTPIVICALYFFRHGALTDALFYTWNYNLQYYAADIGVEDRIQALSRPFLLLAGGQPLLLLTWMIGGLCFIHALLQRHPTSAEKASGPGRVYLLGWTLTALGGAASGGRPFDHYLIQLLPPLCLGLGLVLASLFRQLRSVNYPSWLRFAAGLLLIGAAVQLIGATITARQRTLPEDPSRRVAAYIHVHSDPHEWIFVWGFHPDIYLHADRKPASRFLYCSFQTGLIPWTNIAPERNTADMIVPGAMELLLADLTATKPRFIVDCSAGPNRHWQKYPLENFPKLRDHVSEHYRVVESGQFVPQGFRLFERRPPGDYPPVTALAALPAQVAAAFTIATLGPPLAPTQVSTSHGAAFIMRDGRAEYFAHAPSELIYPVPAGVTAVRGGFGFRPGAYAPDNPGPTDGAEFIIRWRNLAGAEQILLRRLLRPLAEPADREIQSFRVNLPGGEPGELHLLILPGPAENPASDWTFWTDLMLENFR